VTDPHNRYELSTDPTRLDLDLIHRWLADDAYWALGRSRATVERSIAGSLVFGAYDPTGAQVAVLRAVTDGAVFAYLCDVYVDPAVRGAGLGTWLVGSACEHLRSLGIGRILLATADAHGLYARFGFGPLTEPQRWMELPADRPTTPVSSVTGKEPIPDSGLTVRA
jgi:GNAT superfamily N-acetyltransferase